MATVADSTAEGSSTLSLSKPAMDETKIAGCEITVESNSSFGPLTHFKIVSIGKFTRNNIA